MCVKFYLSTMDSDQCGTCDQFWSCDILETYDIHIMVFSLMRA